MLFKLIALMLLAPAAFAYSIHLFPATEFSTTPAEELSRREKLNELVIEDFEDNQLVEGLRATLPPSISPDAGANVWDGQNTSKEVNAALFEFDSPGIRFFGVGISDNDFGRETLALNGGWQIRLSSLPNYNSHGQGKAFYLVVAAEENDPDLRSVSIANGYTIAFDHLILARSSLTVPIPDQQPNLSVVHLAPGGGRLQNMADRIRRQQLATPTPTADNREGELVLNGGFDQVKPSDDGPRGTFGETMFDPGSTHLPGWTILDSLVSLRGNPPSPAGGMIMELGPRNEPGAISQRIKTEPGKDYELSFLAAGGRNNQIKASIAGKEQVIDCPSPSNFKRVKIPFRSTASETELILSGIGNQGFGPMIDDVSVVPTMPAK